MEKKTTKKVMKLSSETLSQLERREAEAAGLPGTQESKPTCCP